MWTVFKTLNFKKVLKTHETGLSYAFHVQQVFYFDTEDTPSYWLGKYIIYYVREGTHFEYFVGNAIEFVLFL